MTIRIMLVGLVASMGFELPSGSDVARWAKAGASWTLARMADPSGSEVSAKLDLAGPSDCQQASEDCDVPILACEKEAALDQAFQVATDGMTADLLADCLEAMPGVRAEPLLAVEEPAKLGLPEGEERGCLVVADDPPKASEYDSAWPIETTEVVKSPEKVDRVSSAVRLTREAIQAWAAVIDRADEECQPSR